MRCFEGDRQSKTYYKMDFLPSWVPISSMAVQKPLGGSHQGNLGLYTNLKLGMILAIGTGIVAASNPSIGLNTHTHTHPCIFVTEQPGEEKREHLTDLQMELSSMSVSRKGESECLIANKNYLQIHKSVLFFHFAIAQDYYLSISGESSELPPVKMVE